MEQSELKIPEDQVLIVYCAHSRPAPLCLLCRDEHIAELESQLATLGRKISDEEWHEIWSAGMCLGMVGNEGATKEGFDALISARVAELSRKP